MPIVIEKEGQESYPDRIDKLNSIKGYSSAFFDSSLSEPHTSYNLCHLLDFFPKSPLKSALCIGYCFLKESTLLRENCLKSIQTWDIDSDLVIAANKVIEKLEINSNVQNRNILNEGIDRNKYDMLLLFQMDYIFSNDELDLILQKATDANIKECVVMTPSLLHLSLPLPKEKNIFFHDLIILIGLLKIKFKTIRFRSNVAGADKGYKVYTRFKGSLLKLFSKNGYELSALKTTMNSNGSFHYMHFYYRERK